MIDTQTDTAIHKQLSSLPVKVGKPLLGLLKSGHIDSLILSTVLDAGKLVNDNTRLLGFAISYLYLRSQNIPVGDVIRMAKSQNRRINLSWSGKRWELEHNRLSRAETLDKLSADHIDYDLKEYQSHLPKQFAGYLIKNSRRLGMEGLRQRHCVASYHERITSGSCAIGTVFVNKERWTIQLISTQNTNYPIRLIQVKGKLNKNPTSEQLKAINSLLGIPEDTKVVKSLVREYNYQSNLQLILPVLRELGIEEARVEFNGSGDSGAIDGVDYFPKLDIGNTEVETIRRNLIADQGRYETEVQYERQSLTEAIEDLTDDYLDETDVDWYNNDGGFGTLVIDVTDGTVRMEVYTRYTESELEYEREFDIVSGDDI